MKNFCIDLLRGFGIFCLVAAVAAFLGAVMYHVLTYYPLELGGVIAFVLFIKLLLYFGREYRELGE